MSKTSKIRTLKKQLLSSQKKVDLLEWLNNQLIRKTSIKVPSKYYTPRPIIKSKYYEQERYYNTIVRYIYTKMDREYQKSYDLDEDVDNIKFVVYVSRDVFSNLCDIAGFSDFYREGDVQYFRGHKVVCVVGETDYVDFVRVYE